MESQQQIIVKNYKGSQSNATAAFKQEASEMAAKNYFPTSQNWSPGSYSCGEFVFALLLCAVVIGVLVFIYMIIVKPDGILSVTYELKKIEPPTAAEKQCPRCAETIKSEAKVCRFCGHNFDAAA
jgi:hypothetical protein